MNTLKNTLIVLLGLTTIGSAYLAWSQSKQLAELQDKPPLVSSQFQDSSAAAEKASVDPLRETQDRVTNPSSQAKESTSESPTSIRQQRRRAFLKVRESNEYKQLKDIVTAEELESKFAALFGKLNLSPDELQAFKSLLLEKRNLGQDVFAAARSQGITLRNNQDLVSQLVNDNVAVVDQEIREKFGDEVFDTYKNFEKTNSIRGLTNQLQRNLSYSNNPLHNAQQEQLIDLIARLPRESSGSFLVSEQTMNIARGILTSDPFVALERIQTERQSKTKMRELIFAAQKPAPSTQ